MVAATLKFELSAIWTVPPVVRFAGGELASAYVKGFGGDPAPPFTAPWSAASGPGTAAWKIQRLCRKILLKTSAPTPKFSAKTSGGVWAIQSVTRSVLYSVSLPSSKQRMNSHPSGPKPCSECGYPAGKYHKSPAPTSATKARPWGSNVVTRQLP